MHTIKARLVEKNAFDELRSEKTGWLWLISVCSGNLFGFAQNINSMMCSLAGSFARTPGRLS